MNKPYILIVEDDRPVRNLIATTLDTQNYNNGTAETGNQAIGAILSQNPNLLLLDLGLPDIDGIDIIRKVRTWSILPIIVISARDEDRDKIEALDAGADDYLTKPFSPDELLARIRTALRRLNYVQNSQDSNHSIFINGRLKIDYGCGCAYMDGMELHLTPIEYKLLCLMAKNSGKVLTHKYITREIWGSSLESDVASLRVHMATLRKKLDKDSSVPAYIQTHVGIGYRMLRVD